MAQIEPDLPKLENTHVHSPLGNAPDLARHLILWAVDVPA